MEFISKFIRFLNEAKVFYFVTTISMIFICSGIYFISQKPILTFTKRKSLFLIILLVGLLLFFYAFEGYKIYYALGLKPIIKP